MDAGHPSHRIQGSVNPLDLRLWLAEAQKLGEVRDVKGADWNLELGAISELNVKKDAPRAALRRDQGLPQGLSRAHLQHEQSCAALFNFKTRSGA